MIGTESQPKPGCIIVMNSLLTLRFWCDKHKYIPSGYNTEITEVYFDQNGELARSCPLCLKSRPMTIEVYTGRDDCSGNKVFGGDIVTYEGYELPAEVEWIDDLCQWTLMTRIYDGDGEDDFYLQGEPIDPDLSIKVIGNRHEGENLLEP